MTLCLTNAAASLIGSLVAAYVRRRWARGGHLN